MDHYRYWKTSYGEEIRVIFLDCRRQLDNFLNFLFTTMIVSFIGLLSVLFLMIYFSGRIVKPFSDNYEKQKRFITDAGHELKTPLTVISANSELARMTYGNSEWFDGITV